MSRNEILKELIGIVVSADESLAGRAESMTEETRILEDLGMNSVGMLFLAVMIEETFKIRLDNVAVSDLRTLGDAVTMIEVRQS